MPQQNLSVTNAAWAHNVKVLHCCHHFPTLVSHCWASQLNPLQLLHDNIMEMVNVRDLVLPYVVFEGAPQMLKNSLCLETCLATPSLLTSASLARHWSTCVCIMEYLTVAYFPNGGEHPLHYDVGIHSSFDKLLFSNFGSTHEAPENDTTLNHDA